DVAGVVGQGQDQLCVGVVRVRPDREVRGGGLGGNNAAVLEQPVDIELELRAQVDVAIGHGGAHEFDRVARRVPHAGLVAMEEDRNDLTSGWYGVIGEQLRRTQGAAFPTQVHVRVPDDAVPRSVRRDDGLSAGEGEVGACGALTG